MEKNNQSNSDKESKENTRPILLKSISVKDNTTSTQNTRPKLLESRKMNFSDENQKNKK